MSQIRGLTEVNGAGASKYMAPAPVTLARLCVWSGEQTGQMPDQRSEPSNRAALPKRVNEGLAYRQAEGANLSQIDRIVTHDSAAQALQRQGCE